MTTIPPDSADLTPEQWRRLLAAVFGPPRLIYLPVSLVCSGAASGHAPQSVSLPDRLSALVQFCWRDWMKTTRWRDGCVSTLAIPFRD
jgi:hypothetical protein